jgi:hypothetical protein
VAGPDDRVGRYEVLLMAFYPKVYCMCDNFEKICQLLQTFEFGWMIGCPQCAMRMIIMKRGYKRENYRIEIDLYGADNEGELDE